MGGCGPSFGIIDGVGAGSGSIDGFDVFPINFETTDATPVIQQWGNLAVIGAGVLYEGRVEAIQDTGANGQYAFIGGTASRDAVGSGQVNPIIGGAGYVPPGPAWATPGAPGWTMILAQLAGDILQINMAGLAGQTVRWRGWIIRSFTGGATP